MVLLRVWTLFLILCVCGITVATQAPCPQGSFGANCRGQCHCLNGPRFCRSLDGRCTDNKCSYGWIQPPYCQIRCPTGTYGLQCRSRCRCANNAVCNHVNGVCETGGCAFGWGGASCQRAMPILFSPPVVTRSVRGLVIEWPRWVANVTGNGSGPVVGYTLEALSRPLNDGASAAWHNLHTVTENSHRRWFRYVADGLRPNTGYKFRVRLAKRHRDKVEQSTPGLATDNWTVTPCAAPSAVATDVNAYMLSNSEDIFITWQTASATSSSSDPCASIRQHDVLVTYSDPSCSNVTLSVPWPQKSAELRGPTSRCQLPLYIRVHAVSDAGVRGPTSELFVLDSEGVTTVLAPVAGHNEDFDAGLTTASEAAVDALLTSAADVSSTDSSTTAAETSSFSEVIQPSLDHSTAPAGKMCSVPSKTVPDAATDVSTGLPPRHLTERELIGVGRCVPWQRQCTSGDAVNASALLDLQLQHQNCSFYRPMGGTYVSIVNRTETSLLLQPVSKFHDISRDSGHILTSVESVRDRHSSSSDRRQDTNSGCRDEPAESAAEIELLADGAVLFSSLRRATLYRVNLTIVLRSSYCIRLSSVLTTAPAAPVPPPTPRRVDDLGNGSLRVVLPPAGRRQRRALTDVVSTRLIVVELAGSNGTLSALIDGDQLSLVDLRARDADYLFDYPEAMRQNLSFYIAGELLDDNATEFVIGDPSPSSLRYTNPLVVDLELLSGVYAVSENYLDSIYRRAFSERLAIVAGAGAPVGPAVSWWVWLIVFVVIVVCVIVVLAVVLHVRRRRRRRAERRYAAASSHAAAARQPQSALVSALAHSYLDGLLEEKRRERAGRGHRGSGLDSHSDADGEFSFAEPRPVYDAPRSRHSHGVPVGQLRRYCERVLWSNGGRGLADEFASLPAVFTGPVSVNSPRKRAHDAVPYEHNRVRLASGDYVNASCVQTLGRRRFIVTQHPTPATASVFWQLVWERDVTVVIALVGVSEPECAPYWPPQLNHDVVVDSSTEISVELTGVGVLAHFVVRELLLERSGQRRRVMHWQYTWWCRAASDADAETAVPCHPVDFNDFVKRVRADDANGSGLQQRGSCGSVLVHCAAGGGRAGVFLAVDALLDQGRFTGVVDVVKCVALLRTERCGLVRSLRQYNFLYQCLCEEFDHIPTRFSVDNFTAKSRPDEFSMLFQPAYFAVMCVNAPARRASSRHVFDRCLPEVESQLTGDDDVDDMPAMTCDSFVQREAFVVSQCPRPLNADGFWAVAAESAAACAVCLGDLTDLVGHELVVPRFVGASVSTHRHSVECCAVQQVPDAAGITAYDFELTISDRLRRNSTAGGARHRLRLFEFTSWPADRSTPSVSTLVMFTTVARCWQQRVDASRPMLVFGPPATAAGLCDRSRAAVFIALWRLMEQADLEAVIDVFATARVTCSLLPSSLISQDQYELLYAAVKEFLLRRDNTYALGADCRAFPRRAAVDRAVAVAEQSSPAVTGRAAAAAAARHRPPHDEYGPGPWRTPDPLPSDPALGRPPTGAEVPTMSPLNVMASNSATAAVGDDDDGNASTNHDGERAPPKFLTSSASSLDVNAAAPSSSQQSAASSALPCCPAELRQNTAARPADRAHVPLASPDGDEAEVVERGHPQFLTSSASSLDIQPPAPTSLAATRSTELAALDSPSGVGPLTSTPLDHAAAAAAGEGTADRRGEDPAATGGGVRPPCCAEPARQQQQRAAAAHRPWSNSAPGDHAMTADNIPLIHARARRSRRE